MFKMRQFLAFCAMRKGTFKMRERGCQMRHFRAIAQDLAALTSTKVKICQTPEMGAALR